MNERTTTQTASPQERCISGVEGIDAILGGGFPKDCFYLIQGDPGSGKTTMALQFLLEGVRRGERVFYITLSESKTELLKVAASHGWSLAEIPLLELSAIETLLRPEAQTTVFHASEVELGRITALLRDELRRIQPTRIVFDSLSEFRLMAETPLRYRRQLLSLKQEFATLPSTVLLLDDKMANEQIGVDPHILSLAHGVIEMEQLSPDYGSSRRRLRVLKMRGVKFSEGFHDYIIATGGIRVFPRLVAGHHRGTPVSAPVSSGSKRLTSCSAAASIREPPRWSWARPEPESPRSRFNTPRASLKKASGPCCLRSMKPGPCCSNAVRRSGSIWPSTSTRDL
jgi:circadian clock protein KaiC